jgi:hypothetical protein
MGIADDLDQLAQEIRSAKDFNERAAAIAAFKNACRNNLGGPLSPSVEAASRDTALVNPLPEPKVYR